MVRIFLLAALLFAAPAAKAQVLTPPARAEVPRLVLAEPGEPTVSVFVIGGATSGLYEVGIDRGLDELLVASAGGALGMQSADEARRVTVKVLRPQGGVRNVVYESPLDEVFLNRADYPTFQEGDVLEIETVTRRKFSWRDGLQILTSASTLILIARNVGLF